MVKVLIIIVVIIAIGGLIAIKYRQRKIDKTGWDDISEIIQTIVRTESKKELEIAQERLDKIQKESFDNERLCGACWALSELIDEIIEEQFS